MLEGRKITIEHKNIPDAQLHEVKGAAGATSGQVLTATGSGTATFQTLSNYVGFWDNDDSATAGSPIAITLADTYYYLTNDTLGPSTQLSYGLNGITNIWDSTSQSFDFSGLDIGDMVDIRIDISPTTSAANDNIKVDLELGIGSATNFYIPFVDQSYKSSGAHRAIRFNGFYIGSADVRDNPAKFAIKSDTTGDTVVVNGWYTRVIKRSLG